MRKNIQKYKTFINKYEEALKVSNIYDFTFSKEIKWEVEHIFNLMLEIVFHNITNDKHKLQKNFLIQKKKNEVLIKELLQNKEINYIAKVGNEYIDFLFQVYKKDGNNCIYFKKTFISKKNLNKYQLLIANNESKKEFKLIYRYLKKQNKKISIPIGV